MKLFELEVRNFRGVCDLTIKPMGKNLVVFGPNGTGKSTVVDALEFLFTGRLSRLTGPGTGGITLSKHAHHIKSEASSAVVKGLFEVDGLKNPLSITRTVGQPESRTTTSQGTSNLALRPIVDNLPKLQVLTRKNLISYILVEPGKRASQVEELLNLAELGEIRKTLYKAANDASKAYDKAQGSLNASVDSLRRTLALEKSTPDPIVESTLGETVNECRALLGVSQLEVIQSSTVKSGLTADEVVLVKTAPKARLELAGIKDFLAKKEEAEVLDTQLYELVQSLLQDAQTWIDVNQKSLLDLGLSLIKEDGICPLCETRFPEGELKDLINKRIEKVLEAEPNRIQLTQLSSQLITLLQEPCSCLSRNIVVAETFNLDPEKVLNRWLERLQSLIELVGNPLSAYRTRSALATVLKEASEDQALLQLSSQRDPVDEDKASLGSPRVNAWDRLTRIEENLKAIEAAKIALESSLVIHNRASALYDSFIKAKDKVLMGLYFQVEQRFISLYRTLHSEDESIFTAKLVPDEAALDFDVDFHGKGLYPPGAYHSEGHQDSMGLCLYLALVEALDKECRSIIVLDDIVTSVDAEHRRRVCELLKDQFMDRQILITTHDSIWHKQLLGECVVGCSLEIPKWTLDGGPRVKNTMDLWEEVMHSLDEENNLKRAAACMREGLEEFFAQVCHNLRVKILFKIDKTWTLGDLLNPAEGRLESLIEEARKAADSRGQTEEVAKFEKLKQDFAEVRKRCRTDQWIQNPNVHYHFDKWGNFVREDFDYLVPAFKELCSYFKCSNEEPLKLVVEGGDHISLTCSCGATDWRLKKLKTQSQK